MTVDERPERGERAQLDQEAAPPHADTTALPAPLTTALPPRLEAWRRRSFTGALMTGVALGLAEALEVPRSGVAIVAQAPGEPLGPPGRMQVELDPDDPTRAAVIIRPWLFSDPPEGRHSAHPAPPAAEHPPGG